ncbi:methyltransferase family protein [Nitrospirillum bahiense]|uniref:Methyltransferase family protein n=1 Tax=Nitrospirillum amazonense TaxID=28077 RepID=A0A560G3U3_9PROT|nr:methyltransferase family protein [Nitrospirillum amazonense]
MAAPVSARASLLETGRNDALQRSLIPCFDAFYGAALTLIDDWSAPTRPRVLDLGANGGLFASLVRTRLPHAHLHLVEETPQAMEQSRRRFAGDARVSFALAELEEAELGGPWDLVISSLAIHHLDHSAKRDLYGRVNQVLAPGGLFISAEQVLGPTAEVESQYDRLWQSEASDLGVPAVELSRARDRLRQDHCATLGEQLMWMAEAGLRDVDCAFKSWRFAVMSARHH